MRRRVWRPAAWNAQHVQGPLMMLRIFGHRELLKQLILFLRPTKPKLESVRFELEQKWSILLRSPMLRDTQSGLELSENVMRMRSFTLLGNALTLGPSTRYLICCQ